MGFDRNIYHGFFIRRDVVGAMEYIEQFPEQADLYDRFRRIYEQEQYITYQIDDDLDRILTVYQRYYRDVFYLCIGREQAEDKLRRRLAALFKTADEDAGLPDLEQNQVTEAFRSRGMYFRGGKTDGYYGPYIWRTTETAAYEVELPEGAQTYKVKLLDGFIAKSWMDYISFGEVGTGGWADSDGVICCVKSSYDFDSEDFRVSLLKHEAQHAWDLAHSPDMSSEDLEYRAKLVELIYSRQRNLLRQFAVEAVGSDDTISGHAGASRRIVEGIAGIAGRSAREVSSLSVGQIHWAAEKLFARSGFSFSDEFDVLRQGEMELRITEKQEGDEIMLPFYYYDIYVDGKAVGKISIRIGGNYHSYYNGNIGYEVDEEYRGKSYAYRACRLLLQVARAHGMTELILACSESNAASYKTFEKLGAELVEVVKPPKDYFAYYEEMERERIYRLVIA